MKKVLLSILGVLMLIIMCFLGACSSATTTTTAPAPMTTTTAPPLATTTTAAPAPVTTTTAPPLAATTTAAQPPATTTTAAQAQFVIAEGGHAQSSLDPLSNRADISDISVNVFDTLVCYDQNHKLTSNVCSGWQALNGGKTIEFKIKPGIKFSSGDPLTAADVEWSFNRLMAQMPQFADQISSYDHMQVVDDSTIDFYFKVPYTIWPAMTQGALFICSKTYHDKVGEDAYVNNPVGTGPYKYAGWKMGQYTDLAVNDYYYGTKPQIQNVRFDVVSDQTTQIAMLKSGEADIATDVPLQMVPSLKQAGYKEATYQMPHQVRLQFVLTNPNTPWSNLKVRQAIDYAIDKDALIKVFNGIPLPADSWLESWEVGYDPTLKPNYPYDLAKAKQLMSDAGYANGFNMPLYYTTNMTGAKDIADYLTNALQQININVTLIGGPMDPSFLTQWAKWHSDPTSVAVFLSDGGLMGNADPLLGLNFAYVSSGPIALFYTKDLDAIVTQIANSSDPAERATLIKQAIQIINDNLPDVPIFNVVSVDMMKSNVTFTPNLYSGMGTINVKDMTAN